MEELTSVRMPIKVRDELKVYAAQRKISMKDIISHLLEKAIEREE